MFTHVQNVVLVLLELNKYFLIFILIANGLSKECFCHESGLLKLHPKERFYLECFFKELVFEDGFAYTLFFDNHICFSGYLNQPSKLIKAPNSLNFAKGWRFWKKYENLFPHPNFIFIEEPLKNNELAEFESRTGEKIQMHAIYIINKKELKKLLIQHVDLFNKELGPSFHLEEFMQQIASGSSLSGAIHHHEGLLGLLLGYGRESAIAYDQHQKNGFKESTRLKPLSLQPTYCHTNKGRCQVQSIQFVGDPDSKEVQEILEKNRRQKVMLSDIYAKGDFLEITLHELSKE